MEMMITVGILTIVGAIAIPSYIGQITKSRRTDAKVTLADTAQKLERCFTDANTYEFAADTLSATCPQDSDLDNLSEYYSFELDIDDDGTTYELTATATTKQANRDSNCKTLTLNNLNEKKSTNSSNADSSKCW